MEDHAKRPSDGRPEAVDFYFYFDFSSPYGYFMAEKIDVIAARYSRRVTWRPVLLFAVLRALELPAPLEHPIKRAYMFADFERSAAFLGIDYQLPASFPAVTQYAARAFYLLAEQSHESAVHFAKTVLRAYWREGRQISDVQVIAKMMCEARGDEGVQVSENLPAACDALRGEHAKTLLQMAIAGAVEQQVFGSPFVIVDGEPFFGVDRIGQIEKCLSGKSSIHES